MNRLFGAKPQFSPVFAGNGPVSLKGYPFSFLEFLNDTAQAGGVEQPQGTAVRALSRSASADGRTRERGFGYRVMFRWMTLTLGPVLIVGGLYWLLRPEFGTGLAAAQNESHLEQPLTETPAARGLEATCTRKAEDVSRTLGPQGHVIVRAPFVVAGDFAEADVERIYQQTIVPTARALFVSYFDKTPTEPITILLFSTDTSYRRYAEEVDGNPRAEYSGYYERGDRRVVINLSTGSGTLAHELTHALAQGDFPDMPEWFDEGLASLHEESKITEDGLRIVGASNWRLQFLIPAIRGNSLQSLEALMTSRRVRTGQQSVDYAQARYLCLFLQQRNLLEPFYRKFRESFADDPTGARVLCQLLGVDSLADADREFREWVLRFPRDAR